MDRRMTIKKNIKEEVGAIHTENFLRKIVDCMEYSNTEWVESNETGEIISISLIKICRDVLTWINDNNEEFNFYEDFK